jgi:phosphatidylglycerophosphate synthase
VSFIAKIKTTVQMLGIGLMLFQYPLGSVPIYDIGIWTLFVSAGLTLWSMCLYLLAAWPYLRQER